jgi:hypothetical protein
MEQVGALEMSVNNYQPTLPNILEEGKPQLELCMLHVTLTNSLGSWNIQVSWDVNQCHWVNSSRGTCPLNRWELLTHQHCVTYKKNRMLSNNAVRA